MVITAVLLVLAGAVFAAFYNVLTKKVQTAGWKERTSALVALHQGGAAIVLFGLGFATGGPEIQEGFLLPMLATGVLNVGIMFGRMRARALEEVSLVAPIDSTTPAIVIVTSMIILGEYPSTLGWTGIMFLVAGTYVLNVSSVRKELERRIGPEEENGGIVRVARIYLAPFLALRRSVGVRWAFFSVLLSTVSLNFDGLVARRANIGFGFGCVFGITALGNLAVALKRREFRGVSPREAFGKAIWLAVFFALSNFVTNFAFRHSIVPYVGTMKRLQIPLTIVLAYFMLGERKSFRERFAGGALMLAGAVLIGLG